ncbi:metal-dependent hydrolase [Sulfobacillus sp. hq2]|nr:metal-dependent hydrolase [Sulfobacillus sp. hq2]
MARRCSDCRWRHVRNPYRVRLGEEQRTVGSWLSWLGQSGFLLEHQGVRMVIDPFLSETPGAMSPHFDVYDLGSVHWILSTHEHLDHWDHETIARLKEANPQARIVAPGHLRSRAADAGFLAEEFVVPSLTHPVHLTPDVAVQAVSAVHAVHSQDGYGSGEKDQFLGYILSLEGLTLYHSGDTILSQALLDRLMDAHIDIAMLPINGRDFFRDALDIVGNLGACEAVDLAGRIGASILIPMHYDAFAGNLGDVGQAARYAHERWPYMTVAVLGYGQKWPMEKPIALPHHR